MDMEEDMDINCGQVIDGEKDIDENDQLSSNGNLISEASSEKEKEQSVKAISLIRAYKAFFL